jgi:hypothetical protein
MAMPKVTATDVIHAVVVSVAKAKGHAGRADHRAKDGGRGLTGELPANLLAYCRQLRGLEPVARRCCAASVQWDNLTAAGKVTMEFQLEKRDH